MLRSPCDRFGVRQDIVLEVEQSIKLDFTLEVGARLRKRRKSAPLSEDNSCRLSQESSASVLGS